MRRLGTAPPVLSRFLWRNGRRRFPRTAAIAAAGAVRCGAVQFGAVHLAVSAFFPARRVRSLALLSGDAQRTRRGQRSGDGGGAAKPVRRCHVQGAAQGRGRGNGDDTQRSAAQHSDFGSAQPAHAPRSLTHPAHCPRCPRPLRLLVQCHLAKFRSAAQRTDPPRHLCGRFSASFTHRLPLMPLAAWPAVSSASQCSQCSDTGVVEIALLIDENSAARVDDNGVARPTPPLTVSDRG